MKLVRVLALVLVLVLFVVPSAFAAVDLSGMSYEELVALRDSINAELLSRGIEKKVNVPAGEYIIGKDIPAGEYKITTEAILINVVTLDKQGNYVGMHSVSPERIIGKLMLTDGMTIKITGGYAIFEPYTGLGF